jgi:hypothetical protein
LLLSIFFTDPVLAENITGAIAIGYNALAAGNNTIALGDQTQTPDGINDYVNLGNEICIHKSQNIPCPNGFSGDPSPENIMRILYSIGKRFSQERDPDDPRVAELLQPIGKDLMEGRHSLALGYCAGPPGNVEDSTRNILLGSFTTTPTRQSNNFVNIDNMICFWRDTLNKVDCPPPQKCREEK